MTMFVAGSSVVVLDATLVVEIGDVALEVAGVVVVEDVEVVELLEDVMLSTMKTAPLLNDLSPYSRSK